MTLEELARGATEKVVELQAENAALKDENERLKAGEASVRDALGGYDNHADPAHEIVKSIRHRHDSYVDTICDLKARMAELAAPAVQGEPVASLLIGEPEHTKQGWEPGDWDIEPNATTIDAFAKLAKPGAYQLYLAPQPAEQKPAPNVAGLVEAGMRPKWVIKRKQIASDGRSIETQLLVHIDVAGCPNWICERNTVMQPILFQSEEWALVNFEHCKRYLERHSQGAKFEVELDLQQTSDTTKQPVERDRS